MLESQLLQRVVFPVGALYLMLHAGPLFRMFYRPSIRGGTRWRFFGSEVLLFTGWLLASPVLWHSTLGRAAIAAHLTLHVAFTAMDYFAHDFLLGFALTPWHRSPVKWVTKEIGLVVDTATHAIVVALVARALPLSVVVLSVLLAVAGYALATRYYLRNFAAPAPGLG